MIDNTLNLAEWSRTPFEGQDEIVSAMTNPRYNHPYGEGYRNAVEAKLLLTPDSVTRLSGVTGTEENVVRLSTGGGSDEAELARVQAAEFAKSQQAVADNYGPLALPAVSSSKISAQ